MIIFRLGVKPGLFILEKMKKLLLVLSLIPSLLFAQNIDDEKIKNDWKNLVSYVGSQYFKSIVEEYLPKANSKETEAYDTNIKNYINKSTLNSPTSLNSIQDFSEWDSSRKKWEEYNKKMNLSGNERNFNNLFSGVDEKHIRNVRAEIIKEYTVLELRQTNIQNVQKVEQNKVDNLDEEIKTMGSKQSQFEEQISTIKSMVYPALIALLALLAGISFWFYKQITAIKENLEAKEQKNINHNVQSILENEIGSLKSKISSLSKDIENLESLINKVQNTKPQVAQQNQPQSITPQPQAEPVKASVKPQQELQVKEPEIFLEYFDNGEFKEGSETKCFYRMEKNSRKFFFIESKLKEALANNGFPMDICIGSGSKNGATRVKLTNPGKVEQQSNGRWKVVERINLKFE